MEHQMSREASIHLVTAGVGSSESVQEAVEFTNAGEFLQLRKVFLVAAQLRADVVSALKPRKSTI